MSQWPPVAGRTATTIAVVLLAAVLALQTACGGATPTSPTSSVATLAGSWSGSISDPISGTGSMQLALSEPSPALTGAPLSGTWSATFKNGDSFSGPAVAALAANGYGIILNVQTALTPCATGPGGGAALIGFTLINVVVTSSELTAVSERFSCSGAPLVGTVTLSKQ